jgi:NAD(P)-dependent dehydrogenase (short-subunit alcohol dehydrogenase family)
MERKAGQIEKPTVLITGAGRGLGLCLARRFRDGGFLVYAGIRAPSEGLKALAGPDLHELEFDVSNDRSVNAAAGNLSALDILINNAAICEDEGGRIESLDLERVANIMNVNAFGPLRVTKAFLPLLRAGGMKTIANISSEAGSISDCWRKGMFGYCMSKASLNMQSKLLYNYLQEEGFRLLSIHPGWMKTDMGGKNADIEPKEAAEGIYQIIKTRDAEGKDLYIDYKGKTLRY